MIKEFVDKFNKDKDKIQELFEAEHPGDYSDVVKNVITVLAELDNYDAPDPERIHLIDDGDYQGTLVFVIAQKGYQPSNYWYVRVYYGSCSGCDTLEAIRGYSNEKPNEQQVKDYMTLALHIVQGLKGMDDESV